MGSRCFPYISAPRIKCSLPFGRRSGLGVQAVLDEFLELGIDPIAGVAGTAIEVPQTKAQTGNPRTADRPYPLRGREGPSRKVDDDPLARFPWLGSGALFSRRSRVLGTRTGTGTGIGLG
jgi:hypothetical protein